MSGADHLRLGRAGEEAALARLRRLGYEILERNYRVRGGEVDLICAKAGTVVFVEVKTRGPGSLAAPEEAVHARKRSRLVKAAAAYLSANNLWNRPCRFDVVTVLARDGEMRVTHLENAFGMDAVRDRGTYQPF